MKDPDPKMMRVLQSLGYHEQTVVEIRKVAEAIRSDPALPDHLRSGLAVIMKACNNAIEYEAKLPDLHHFCATRKRNPGDGQN